ncbi:hypothetical protein, partial [Photobacterium sp. OFAV2-7]|uniref:hypothetical protein n=1 Tax=Photobacterium sp. OFAV2-7 TaxID=2917748 RepID=UPI001EF67BBF
FQKYKIHYEQFETMLVKLEEEYDNRFTFSIKEKLYKNLFNDNSFENVIYELDEKSLDKDHTFSFLKREIVSCFSENFYELSKPKGWIVSGFLSIYEKLDLKINREPELGDIVTHSIITLNVLSPPDWFIDLIDIIDRLRVFAGLNKISDDELTIDEYGYEYNYYNYNILCSLQMFDLYHYSDEVKEIVHLGHYDLLLNLRNVIFTCTQIASKYFRISEQDATGGFSLDDYVLIQELPPSKQLALKHLNSVLELALKPFHIHYSIYCASDKEKYKDREFCLSYLNDISSLLQALSENVVFLSKDRKKIKAEISSISSSISPTIKDTP